MRLKVPTLSPTAVILLAGCVSVLLGLAGYAGSFRHLGEAQFGSDTLITISRALAAAHPSLYTDDFLFSQPQNYEFYTNASVWFFQLVEYLDQGAFVTWYRVLNIVVVALFLFSWFLLAFRLFGSGPAATAFTACCAVAVPVVSGDYWGLFDEPQARQMFSAVLPLILLAALSARHHVLDWIGVFLLMGAAMWLHPASGPPVALALLVALMVSQYVRGYEVMLIYRAFAGGCVFLAFALPNIWQYYSGIRDATQGADPELVHAAWAMRFSGDYLDPIFGVSNALNRAFGGWRILLPLVSAVGAIVLLKHRHDRERKQVLMIVAFTIAVAFLGGAVPAMEAGIAHAMGRTPAQIDLIRSIRFLVPMLLLVAFWGIAFQRRGMGSRAAALVVAMALAWIGATQANPRYRQNTDILAGLRCWTRIQVTCPVEDPEDLARVVEELSAPSLHPGNVFSSEFGLQIRSYARRSLAFDWKDTGWLAYSNHKQLIENLDHMQRYKTIAAMPDGADKHAAWLGFGASVGADIVVLSSAQDVRQADYPHVTSIGAITVYSKNLP